MLLNFAFSVVVNIIKQFYPCFLSFVPLLVLLGLLLLALDVNESIQLLLILNHVLGSILKA